MRCPWLLSLLISAATVASAAPEITFDAYGIPTIRAGSWEEAAHALGGLHARERVFQMELYRRTASGTLSELFGESQLQSDIRMRQLQIRRSSQEWWDSGEIPAGMRAELEAYAAGVNEAVAALPVEQLPPIFRGQRPAPWHPVDSIVFFKYMAWDQSGTEDDLWFGMMVEKMGVEAAEALWPMERPYEVPTVSKQAQRPGTQQAKLEPIPGIGDACMKALENSGGVGWLGRGGAFGSNNWAIDGTKTKSGKPILCSDPHLGFSLPSIWYAAVVQVGDEQVSGAFFPTAPFVVIGANQHHAWGITNMQADSVDIFVETVDAQDPLRYQHRGEWKTMERVREEIPVRGRAPEVVDIDYTVHGPVISREGRVLSLQWNGFGRTHDGATTWMLNRAKTLKKSLDALDQLMSPPLNMVYADVDGNIMIHPCGALPIRGGGQGRIPLDGASGKYDWQGWIPREELPLALNPAEHYVASANGRPQPLGYPYYLGWMWDPSYRSRRIHQMLETAQDMTVESMKPVQNDAHDLAAERFLPMFLEVVQAKEAESFAAGLLDSLRSWDYVAKGETIAPMVWQEWLNQYRRLVWDDEWKARDIQQPGGSWGFTGDNHREPEMEVLEFLTREVPQSPWFDDQGTPEIEGRDDIIRSAFREALVALRKKFGEDLAVLAWNKRNILRVSALTQQEEDAREGGPIPGGTFTVNPGSEGGYVGGGASWRMIVDLAEPKVVFGAYPGGQSGDPASEHYADIMKFWAQGEYLTLGANE